MGIGSALFTEQQALEDRLNHRVGVHGDGNGNAEGRPNGLVFADQHVQDDAVDGIVPAVVGQDAHCFFRLAEAVHPAFALFVTGRIPTEVVVHDRIEVFLEVDSFAETFGADQDAFGRLSKFYDAGLAICRRHEAGNGDDLDVLGKPLAQLLGHVLGGRDESAEEDRTIAVFEEALDQIHGFKELGVLFADEFFRFAGHFKEPATVPRCPFGVLSGVASRNDVGSLGVVLCFKVQHGPLADLVGLFG